MTIHNKSYSSIRATLVKKLHPLLEPYGIIKETIADAVEKSLAEINDGCDIQPWLLSLVFWKIFDYKYFLLINPRTPSGNEVSFNVITAAHLLWREALQVAATRGRDDIEAAEALIRVVNVIADSRSRCKHSRIRNITNYIFTGYLNELSRITGKVGSVHLRNLADSHSDDGDFIARMENTLLWNEILAKLPEKEQAIAVFRYILGYSYKETATMMGLSCSYVRKILSRGIQKYVGAVCGNTAQQFTRKRLMQEKRS